MRRIWHEEVDGMLALGTAELDGYFYLNLIDGKAITSKLDENTCQKTFDCSVKDLIKYLRDLGY